MQLQDMKLPYEAPAVELFPLMGSLSMLISFSADVEFDEFEEGGDLDRI